MAVCFGGVVSQTPLAKGEGHHLSSRVALIPVMRAGLGMVDPMLELIPTSQVHHIGIYREPKTLCCVLYYNRLPAKCTADVAIVLEPLIATGALGWGVVVCFLCLCV